ALASACHRGEKEHRGDDRFPGTYFTLEQPHHRPWPGDVLQQRGEHPLLATGQRKRKLTPELGEQGPVHLDRLRGGKLIGEPPAKDEQLHGEEFVEREAQARLLEGLGGRRAVDLTERAIEI